MFAVIILPIIEKKIEEAKKARLALLAAIPEAVVETPAPQPQETTPEESTVEETPVVETTDEPPTTEEVATEATLATSTLFTPPVTEDTAPEDEEDAYAHLRGKEAKAFRARIQAASLEVQGWYREAVTYALIKYYEVEQLSSGAVLHLGTTSTRSSFHIYDANMNEVTLQTGEQGGGDMTFEAQANTTYYIVVIGDHYTTFTPETAS